MSTHVVAIAIASVALVIAVVLCLCKAPVTVVVNATPVTINATSAAVSAAKVNASLAELRVRGVYVYVDGDVKYVVFDVRTRYRGSGNWTVRAEGFLLVADDGNAYGPVSVPYRLDDRFRYELTDGKRAIKYGYAPFQIAFELPKNASPVVLIYDWQGVTIEVPINMSVVFVSYYKWVDVKVTGVEEDCVYADAEPRSIGRSYLQGEQFNVTVEIKVSRYCPAIYVALASVRGAELVKAEPVATPIAPGKTAEIRLVLRAPRDSYSGDLAIEVAAQQTDRRQIGV